MTGTVTFPRHQLGTDFAVACEELAEAQFHQGEKDTPNNRAAVKAYKRRIDTILDLYLDLGSGSPE